jgi:Selenophosphate synthase
LTSDASPTNANARPGDALVLTKPLGTGIATTAIKRGMASRALQKNVIALMSQINTVGADLAELGLVRAATDITGYGLIGHLISLCRASGVSADIDPAAVPIISYEIHELVIWAAFRKEAAIILTQRQFSSIGRKQMRRAKLY